jgi:hypothetical protein
MWYVYELAISGEDQRVAEFYTFLEANAHKDRMNDQHQSAGYVYYVKRSAQY